MKKRILFATDVPFWQTSTGAEQRIFAIHRFLKNEGYTCGVFYLGKLTSAERQLTKKHDIEVFDCASDEPPEKLMNRMRWYADATLNQARNWLFREKGLAAVVDGPASLTLADFEWPWAKTRFAETAEAFQPDCIVFEYIKMAYLVDALPSSQRSKIRCVVDTHDVLYRRAEQFFAHGFPHWLEIDRDQESEVLSKFDAVIAIQEKEAKTFTEMTESNVPVITAGHAVDSNIDDDFDANTGQPPSKIVVGYIGSKNFSNWQAIRQFLYCAWPAVIKKNSAKCELVIAGGICDWFENDGADNSELAFAHSDSDNDDCPVHAPIENLRLLGRIDGIDEFYDQIDVVINPVEFGTGLKIKNAESLRFAKLLITTTKGFDGMPEATRLACKVVENVSEMGLAINSICNNLDSIRPMQQLALELSQTEFSESQAYSELKRYLES